MSCDSKGIFKIHTVSNTHHGITDLVNHGMVENTKIWISQEQNIAFLSNKKILNVRLRRHLLRSYRFVAEVTFKWVRQDFISWKILQSVCERELKPVISYLFLLFHKCQSFFNKIVVKLCQMLSWGQYNKTLLTNLFLPNAFLILSIRFISNAKHSGKILPKAMLFEIKDFLVS